MFTESELEEIANAIGVVYKAIKPNFGTYKSDKHKDRRAAEVAAVNIVCAKIIAEG